MILFGNKFFRRKSNNFFVNFVATNTKKIAMRRITIITGASHTGKTLLAQKILESCAMPYLSIDHLKMGLIRSGHTDLTAQDDDALTDFLWPIVREIIKTAIENHQNLIVEGCYVPADWRQDVNTLYINEIQFICLAFSDSYIDANYDKITAHASDIESRLDDSDCTIDSLKKDNNDVIKKITACGEKVTIIDDDYEKSIMTVMKKIMHQNSENQIERLLEKPFWVVDFLPERVSAERSKQYFAVEDFCCNGQYINQLYQHFAYLIIKLSCYFDIFGNPSPNEIFDSINNCLSNGYVNFLFANEDALITLNGGDLYMTVYNPNGRFLEMVQSLAVAEGLFVREGEKE